MTEELMKEHNIQNAVSAFREHKVPDRLVPEALLTVLSHTFDKNGK